MHIKEQRHRNNSDKFENKNETGRLPWRDQKLFSSSWHSKDLVLMQDGQTVDRTGLRKRYLWPGNTANAAVQSQVRRERMGHSMHFEMSASHTFRNWRTQIPTLYTLGTKTQCNTSSVNDKHKENVDTNIRRRESGRYKFLGLRSPSQIKTEKTSAWKKKDS